MIVSPAGLFDEAQAKVWVERVAAELKAVRRVSLPALGTLRPRVQGPKLVVQFTHAPELLQALAGLPEGDVKLDPVPAWVAELPDLHGAIAKALVSERVEGVDIAGFGLFANIYANPELVEGDKPEHIPVGGQRWVRFRAGPELTAR